VAREYAKHFRESDILTISSTCPAVAAYVQKYVPSLVPNLAPIVSPAVAMGRVIKEVYRPGAIVVFFGPCIAKKDEIVDPNVAGAVDIVNSFFGMRKMFAYAGITVEDEPESTFDGPPGGMARIFPVSGGLLRAAALQADILDNDIVVVDGHSNAMNILRSLSSGDLKARFVDVLFCQGCIDGPVMEGEHGLFARKEAVAEYVRERTKVDSPAALAAAVEQYGGIDLARRFTGQPVAQPSPSEEELSQILDRIGKRQPEDQLNCGACGYATCREKAIAVHQGLAEVEMCLPYLIEQLQTNLRQLQQYQRELQATQAQLVHTEKLASMGQLAAGIAHELNNPLGSILLYSHLIMDQIEPKGTAYDDVKFILEETSRCKSIVAGLLNFARQREVLAQTTDVNGLLEDLRARATRLPEFASIRFQVRLDPALPTTLADPNQLKEVFWNLTTNAQQAMPEGGTLSISTALADGAQTIVIRFEDTGVGIGEDGLKRLFTPFHTTKPNGTGLGLAIAYGIIKMHRGNIEAASGIDKGTTFTITLPVRHGGEANEFPIGIG
jgi:signal transduction histidine kinase